MADVRQRTTLGNRFRFLIRFLGLTGVMTAVVGGTLLSTGTSQPPAFNAPTDAGGVVWIQTVANWILGFFQWQWSLVQDSQNLLIAVAAGLLLGGIAAIVLWILVESLSGLLMVTGRRTAVSTNNTVQIGLAILLLVVVNTYSFLHYKRYDLTRDKQFTLPESVIDKLKKLDPSSPTDIVVLQLHKTSGALSDKADSLDAAAEKKVVEKVFDLVDLIREIGPRFRVTVLDAQAEGYEEQLESLTRNAPELREAIEMAPENSILFRGSKSVQRMSFSEFYLLDKDASLTEMTTPAGRKFRRPSNLVMIPQGVQVFARKVEEVEEKRPKVGLMVIHPELSTRESSDDYSSSGLRKSLEANGFEVVDILVKQWGGRTGPQPAAFTYDEYDFDRMERTFNYLSSQLAIFENNVKMLGELTEKVKTASLSQLDRQFSGLLGGPITDENGRKRVMLLLEMNVVRSKEAVDAINVELKEVGPKYKELLQNDKAVEGRRVSDLKTKLAQAVSDCDLLLIPRLTTIDLSKGYVIRPSFYTLPVDHADAIKAFMKAGKPVLACFGPSTFGNPSMDAPPDDVEKLFTRLGVEFGGQTILTDKEGRAAAERQGDALGSAVDLPAYVFEMPKSELTKESKLENPIAAAFRLTARSVGGKLELRRSGPRPVYLKPSVAARLPFACDILYTVKESWNESKPLGDDEYLPKFEPTKPDDPKKGTHDEERRGPFPIGVALETAVPAEWMNEQIGKYQAVLAAGSASLGFPSLATIALDPVDFRKMLPATEQTKIPKVRVVAFGHGSLFTGKKLEPAQEKLLLHTLNWELKRSDRLPHEPIDGKWQYPRAQLSRQEFTLWRWGTFLGLPLFCGYLGLIVLMTRKIR